MPFRTPDLSFAPDTLLDAMLEGVQVVDHAFRYVYLNPTAARHGRATPEALVGRTMAECYPGIEHTPLYALIRSCLESGTVHCLENPFVFANGQTGYFELRIQPVPRGACILSVDVTARRLAEDERTSAEDRLRHAQRLEAVGQLASAVAHDFNNLLTVMLSQCEIALARPEGPTRADIDTVAVAARSSAELTRQLVAFARRTALRRELLDPAEVLARLEPVLRRAIGTRITLEITAAATRPVEIDRGQLEQILLNLVLNARDAIPDVGRIHITLDDADLDPDAADVGPAAGAYVRLAVRDTGTGMDDATRARIFEPFFTTKPEGRGTGLGLSTVQGNARQSGGDVRVHSAPGAGSTFEVLLPAGKGGPAFVAPPPVTPPRGTARGTLLIAEDAVLLRELMDAVLRPHGYVLLFAADGREAATLLREHGAQVDLLVTDVALPGISGAELIRRARAVRPALPILCVSGFGPAELARHGVPGDVRFLQKPFTPRGLLAAVRELLEAGDTAGSQAAPVSAGALAQ